MYPDKTEALRPADDAPREPRRREHRVQISFADEAVSALRAPTSTTARQFMPRASLGVSLSRPDAQACEPCPIHLECCPIHRRSVVRSWRSHTLSDGLPTGVRNSGIRPRDYAFGCTTRSSVQRRRYAFACSARGSVQRWIECDRQWQAFDSRTGRHWIVFARGERYRIENRLTRASSNGEIRRR